MIPGDIPCAPDRVLQNVCQHCHSSPPKNGAPFSLVTYDDTQREMDGHPLWFFMEKYVTARIMPLPPVEISDGDRAVLLAWLRAGAPARAPGDSCAIDAGIADASSECPNMDFDATPSADARSPADSSSSEETSPPSDATNDDAPMLDDGS